MDYEIAGWLVLRISYAWLLLSALKNLLADRKGTVDSMRGMFPFATELAAWFMFAMMGLSAVSILLGLWAQVAGACMVVFNLMGVRFHLGFAKQAQEIAKQHPGDEAMSEVAAIAAVRHGTSAQKNIVLAAVGLLFALMGTGPFSLTQPMVWGAW